jgi:hypothetical protein
MKEALLLLFMKTEYAADCDEHGENYCESAINFVADFDVVQKTRD